MDYQRRLKPIKADTSNLWITNRHALTFSLFSVSFGRMPFPRWRRFETRHQPKAGTRARYMYAAALAASKDLCHIRHRIFCPWAGDLKKKGGGEMQGRRQPRPTLKDPSRASSVCTRDVRPDADIMGGRSPTTTPKSDGRRRMQRQRHQESYSHAHDAMLRQRRWDCHHL